MFLMFRVRMTVACWLRGGGWHWQYYVGQTECWRCFFDDGYTPLNAVVEDLRAGM